MAKSPTSLRERVLAEELARIRSTYSFQLGLLITESFIRRPWKIPLFPFSFIALNVRFLRSRREAKLGNSEIAPGLDDNCIFLISTSEEGISSAERTAELAHRLSSVGRKIVVMSTLDRITDMLPKTAIVFPMNDPKKQQKELRSQWNAQCENLVSTILDTHLPAQVVFDGPYPYRGILNVMKYYAFTDWVWLRPSGIENESMMLRGKPFDRTVTFRLDEAERQVERRPAKEPSAMPRVLFTPNYTNRSSINKKIHQLLEKCIEDTLWSVVRPAHQDEVNGMALAETTVLNRVLDEQELQKLDAAIVSPNIELVTKLVSLGVPSLCLYSESQDVSDLRRLHARFPNLPLLFAQQNDITQLKLSLATLIHGNTAIRKNASTILPLRLEGLISA